MGNSTPAPRPAGYDGMPLWHPSGRRCCFSDAATLRWRIIQLETLNNAIFTLSKELQQDADQIEFDKLVHNVQMNHPMKEQTNEKWKLLVNDNFFGISGDDENIFGEFEVYLSRSGTQKNSAGKKQDFIIFLEKFLKSRARLANEIVSSCR